MQKVLVPGVLAMERSVTGRDFKITQKNVTDANAKDFLVKGIAWNQESQVLILDVESGSRRIKDHYIIGAFEKPTGELNIIYVLPSSCPTWHLAKAAELFYEYKGKKENVVGKMVVVNVATPVILGGEGWKINRQGTESQDVFEKINLIIEGTKTGEPLKEEQVQETPLEKGKEISHSKFGKLTSEENEIIAFLKSWAEERIKELLIIRRENQTVFVDPKVVSNIAAPHRTPNWVWFDGQEALEDGFIRYKRGKALALESLPGGGKEKFFMTLSYLLYQPLAIILCNGGTNEMQLEGAPVLSVKDGHTITSFQQGLALQLLQRGYIVVLDEVNAVNPAYTFIFHDVANGSREIISQAMKQTIKIHDRAWFAITLNRGTKGTWDLNEAFGDRMSWLVLPRLRDITSVIRANVKDLKERDLKWVASFYQRLTEAAENNQFEPSAISIRSFIDLAERLAEGQTRERAARIAILNKLEIQNPRTAKKIEPILLREAK